MSQIDRNLEYSVQAESRSLLIDGIINNPLHASSLPDGIREAAKMVEYVGSLLPSIPINLRFAESISAIQGFQSAMLNVLLKKKYGMPYQNILINTLSDHAQHFIFSPMDILISPSDPPRSPQEMLQRYERYFPNCDIYDSYIPHATVLTIESTNIYKTKDGRYFHTHASMDPKKTQQALSLSIPPSLNVKDRNAVVELYASLVSKYTASEIDVIVNDQYRQAGTICYSPEEFLATEHGKANAHVGLYAVKPLTLEGEGEKLSPMWWPGGTPERPLQGLKVLDLTRIIAGPSISRSLAVYGAHVLRITSPNVTDYSVLNLDLGWGKWNAYLDLKSPEGRERLRELIKEADVVVDGYRPGVGKRLGFGWEDVGRIWEERGKGGVFARENCYGWNGPWQGRSGWQQISDACCGSSYLYGKGMGLNEAVTPVFPNSDFCTGAAGATGVLQALIERGEKGGSYIVDCALNYYSQWLVRTVSTYPSHIWNTLWETYNRPIFRHTDNMPVTIPALLKLLKDRAAKLRNDGEKGLFDPEFYEDRENKALGVKVRCLKPVLIFPERRVRTGYNVGARPNGKDKAVWPQDLMVEVIE
ncbi:CAIB/BAIF family enzyme [Cyathus striatus]|nr:CAIB/BAIF family enzyme [Cyathus striatus]